ncbi:MAG TPA: DUF268 domain-containing protein [Gemmatimonadaceae bacterium]|nr:DUF268 domain-containing protein [Gemmatimonadaceae bacterium]
MDIGSRVDGFVAHVATFREIEVFDILPNTTPIPGVVFRKADLMEPVEGMADYCDSMSCLHALEHFGLGRYGDPINPDGYRRGIESMARLLKSKGILYLSVPLGEERVEFNAQRVFDPRALMKVASENTLRATSLTLIRHGGTLETILIEGEELRRVAKERYVLGLFTFVKA